MSELIKQTEAELAFNDVHEKALKLASNCENIVILNSDDHGGALQVAKKANTVLKMVDEQRKVMKAPYLETGKMIDGTAKLITEPLKKAVDQAKAVIGEWEEKERVRKEKEMRLLEENLEGAESLGEQSLIATEMIQKEAETDSNTRSSFVYELEDIEQVPDKFLMVDDKAVKAWMKENKDNIEKHSADGVLRKHGLKIYKKNTIVLR